MLSDFPVTPTIAITDLEKSRDFYENKLGFTPDSSMTDGMGVLYKAGNGTNLYLYKRSNPPTADYTLASFRVNNIVQVLEELSQKGVSFEHYDMPGLKTDEKGIAVVGPAKSAWFKDHDGNILSVLQV